MQHPVNTQWWSLLSTHVLHALQCQERGGATASHVEHRCHEREPCPDATATSGGTEITSVPQLVSHKIVANMFVLMLYSKNNAGTRWIQFQPEFVPWIPGITTDTSNQNVTGMMPIMKSVATPSWTQRGRKRFRIFIPIYKEASKTWNETLFIKNTQKNYLKRCTLNPMSATCSSYGYGFGSKHKKLGWKLSAVGLHPPCMEHKNRLTLCFYAACWRCDIWSWHWELLEDFAQLWELFSKWWLCWTVA